MHRSTIYTIKRPSKTSTTVPPKAGWPAAYNVHDREKQISLKHGIHDKLFTPEVSAPPPNANIHHLPLFDCVSRWRSGVCYAKPRNSEQIVFFDIAVLFSCQIGEILPVLSSQSPGPPAAALVPQEKQKAFHPHHQPEDVQDQGALCGGVPTRVQLERRVQHAVQARQQNLGSTGATKHKKNRRGRGGTKTGRKQSVMGGTGGMKHRERAVRARQQSVEGGGGVKRGVDTER